MDKIISGSSKAVWHRLFPGARVWIGDGGPRRTLRVGLVGAGSASGRPLGLLLRAEPGVSALAAADSGPGAGTLRDLAHVPGAGRLLVHPSLNSLDTALADTDLVLISGAAPTPGTPLDALLCSNLAYLKTVLSQVIRIVPMPFIGLLTEPLNALFPAAVELTKARSLNDSKKMFGITTVNALRAEALFAKCYGLPPGRCRVPVVGGCCGNTAVPIFSHASPSVNMDEEVMKELTNELRCLEDNIVRDKNGHPSNLSSAFAALAFTRAMKSVLDQNRTVQVSAMVENNDMGTKYLAGCVQVDVAGAGAMERYQSLTPFECDMLERSLKQLRAEIETANSLIVKS